MKPFFIRDFANGDRCARDDLPFSIVRKTFDGGRKVSRDRHNFHLELRSIIILCSKG